MNINAAFPAFYIDAEYDTFTYRAELKDRGFKWDAERKQWWHKDKAERDEVQEWMPIRDDDMGHPDAWGKY